MFRPHQVKDLGEVRINCALQDQRGWLWFGADKDLLRYDGFSYQAAYLPDSMSEHHISALFETEDRLWVGFRNGAIGYLTANSMMLQEKPNPARPGQRNAFLQLWQPEEGTPAKAITGFARDARGDLWIATYGEGLYCWKNNRLFQIGVDDGLGSDDIYAVVSDKQGRIWAATDAGISICSMTAEGQKQVQQLTTADGLPDEIITTLLADKRGNIWIGTYEHGICRFNAERQNIDFSTHNWPHGPVSSLALFGSNELWVGTHENGVIRLDWSGNTDANMRLGALPDRHALRNARVLSLCKDREGLLWVVCDKGDVYSANVRFGLLETPFSNVQAVLLDCKRQLWAGNTDGLYRQTNGRFSQVLPGKQNVLSLCETPNGQIWVGTFGNGAFVLSPEGKVIRRLTERDGLPNGSILSVAADAHRIWLATLGGVRAYDLHSGKPIRFEQFSLQAELGTSYVYKVFVDKRGRTWFGTDGKGLSVLENNSFRHFSEACGIRLKTIYSITEDHAGNIWFSTAEDGLFCFNGQTFRRYTPENRLHSKAITGLAPEPNGNVLIAYEDGLDVLTPASGHFAFWDPASGMPQAEVNLNALCSDAEGNIWLGAREGILRAATYDEAFLYDPQTRLTAVSVFLEPIDFLSNSSFAYNQNYFIFSFTGLWHTNPELVTYRYRLQGFDPDWKVTKDHLASYPNLLPGAYVFRVQASEHGAFEDTPEATYAFTIREPYWTRWWFVAVCALVLGGLLHLYVRLREARFQREAQLKREKVESQFATLKSQINPHFLFNSFNTLITIIEENPHTAVEYVEHLADFYRSIMVYREKDYISLQEEMEIVRNFDFLLKKRYEDNFQLQAAPFNGHSGAVMPLTLQMLVENAVKHNVISKAKPLLVEIFIENDEYLVVRNNIQRKIKPEASTHFGLQSLVKRYHLLGEKPVIVEESDQCFTVKVPILRPNTSANANIKNSQSIDFQ